MKDASLALGMTGVSGERKEEGAAGRRHMHSHITGFPSAACRPFILQYIKPSCHPELLPLCSQSGSNEGSLSGI